MNICQPSTKDNKMSHLAGEDRTQVTMPRHSHRHRAGSSSFPSHIKLPLPFSLSCPRRPPSCSQAAIRDPIGFPGTWAHRSDELCTLVASVRLLRFSFDDLAAAGSTLLEVRLLCSVFCGSAEFLRQHRSPVGKRSRPVEPDVAGTRPQPCKTPQWEHVDAVACPPTRPGGIIHD